MAPMVRSIAKLRRPFRRRLSCHDGTKVGFPLASAKHLPLNS